MADENIPLHQEDNVVLLDGFDFSQSVFQLNEPDIPSLSNDFTTPSNEINSQLKNFENFLKLAHVNSCSIPKHLHEIINIALKTGLDAIGACETFISKHTPMASFNIPGYNFFHADRDSNKVGGSSRGGVGLYVREEYPAVRIKLPVEMIQPEMLFVQITVGTVKVAITVRD